MTTPTLRKTRNPVLLDEADIAGAAEAARELRAALQGHLAGPDLVKLLMSESDGPREVVLPAPAAQLLADMLTELANGNAVTILPISAELTTQQAADLLGVSRPYLVGLLDQELIPHRRVGNRRRIPMVDFLSYKEQSDRHSQQAATELTRQAQELGMGYQD